MPYFKSRSSLRPREVAALKVSRLCAIAQLQRYRPPVYVIYVKYSTKRAVCKKFVDGRKYGGLADFTGRCPSAALGKHLAFLGAVW